MGGTVKKGKGKKRRRKFSRNKGKKQGNEPSNSNANEDFDEKERINQLITQNYIPVIEKKCYEMELNNLPEETTLQKETKLKLQQEDQKERKPQEQPKFPEPCFKILDNYNIPDLLVKPEGYIRFIERSEEEMDEEVEYDMDEEDAAWLEVINQKRTENGFTEISADTFELLMDRLEKESYFEMSKTDGVREDEALCTICNNGESQAPNAIIFCDMCNLAVHQDCYGVPYIPEGQWLCRRCLHSPSQAVDCVLCPNNAGAFKQTDRGHWAHIVCALWIPEVNFANPVFLEPIYSIETIPPGRWKLMCYVCKQRGVGACIQCYKKNCNLAFHVTCGQQEGLYMQPSNRNEHFTLVNRTAYCRNHTPNGEVNASTNKPKQKKLGSPVISIPTIPPEKIQEISSRVKVDNKSKFIKRILAYWMLKRQLRNGVPLLRRLYHLSHHDTPSTNKFDLAKLQGQIHYWKRIRQDFERVRLLCELVRKREKLKRELIKVKSKTVELELCPMIVYLRRLLEIIKSFDSNGIFLEPVNPVTVPGYLEYIKSPMDLSTMANKIDQYEYSNFEEFQQDFTLMINNCLSYNEKNTVFYKAALKMRTKCTEVLRKAKEDLDIMSDNPDIYFDVMPEDIKQEMREESNPSPIPSVESKISEVEIKNISAAEFDQELDRFMEVKSGMSRKERLVQLNQMSGHVRLIRNTGLRDKRIAKLNKLIYITKKLNTSSKRKKCRLFKTEQMETEPNQELASTSTCDLVNNGEPFDGESRRNSVLYTESKLKNFSEGENVAGRERSESVCTS